MEFIINIKSRLRCNECKLMHSLIELGIIIDFPPSSRYSKVSNLLIDSGNFISPNSLKIVNLGRTRFVLK